MDQVDEDKEERFIEMNIGIVEQSDQDEDGDDENAEENNVNEEDDWSVDSDPDSPESPLKPGHDNDFTSDSDSDSTIR